MVDIVHEVPDAESPSVGPLRERRKVMLTAEIEQVALELFDREGYCKVTVDEIAAAAGISRRTFFRYFATKEDVLAAGKAERSEQIQSHLDARPAGEPVLGSIHQVLRAVAAEMATERDRLTLRERILNHEPELRARLSGRMAPWTDQFIRLIAARMGVDPTVDLRPSLLALSASAAYQSALHTWLNAGEASGVELVDLLDEAFALLERGLGDTSTP